MGVTLANQGTASETFTVTLRDGGSTIGSSSVSLAAGTSTAANFSWNTATAGPVSGETDTADNSRTAGVTVNDASSDTRYSDRLPWTIRVTAWSGGLSGSKTCTCNGVKLSCS